MVEIEVAFIWHISLRVKIETTLWGGTGWQSVLLHQEPFTIWLWTPWGTRHPAVHLYGKERRCPRAS